MSNARVSAWRFAPACAAAAALVVLLAACCVVFLAACSSGSTQDLPSEERAVFLLEPPPSCVGDAPAHYVVIGKEAIAALEARSAPYNCGTVAPGDGGVNDPWSWHYAANSMVWGFLYVAPTGCPSDIERAARGGTYADAVVAWKVTRER